MEDSSNQQLQQLIKSLGDLAAKADKANGRPAKPLGPGQSPVSEVVVPTTTAVDSAAAQTQPPSSRPLPEIEPVSLVPAVTPVPSLGQAAIPVGAAAVQATGSSVMRAVATGSLKVVSLSSATLLQSIRQGWARYGTKRFRRAVRTVTSAIVVVGLTAGGFLLGRRSQSISSVVEVAAAPPISKIAAAPPSEAPQTATQVKQLSIRQAAPAAKSPPAAAPSEGALRHPAILSGKVAERSAKGPAVSGSSEPPPVISTQGAAAEDLLGTSLLEDTARVAPEPPVSVPAARPMLEGGQLQEPKLISSAAPIYPPDARRLQIEGVVVMDTLVDATGKVAEVKVVSGPAFLQQAAMETIRKWKYQPARLDGQPIAFHIRVSISFALR